MFKNKDKKKQAVSAPEPAAPDKRVRREHMPLPRLPSVAYKPTPPDPGLPDEVYMAPMPESDEENYIAPEETTHYPAAVSRQPPPAAVGQDDFYIDMTGKPPQEDYLEFENYEEPPATAPYEDDMYEAPAEDYDDTVSAKSNKGNVKKSSSVPHNLGLTPERLGQFKGNLRPVRKSDSDLNEPPTSPDPGPTYKRSSNLKFEPVQEDTQCYMTWDRPDATPRYGNIGGQPMYSNVPEDDDLYKNTSLDNDETPTEDYYNVQPPPPIPERKRRSDEQQQRESITEIERDIDQLYDGMWQPAHRSSFTSDYFSDSQSNRSSIMSGGSGRSSTYSGRSGGDGPRGFDPSRYSGLESISKKKKVPPATLR